MKTTTKSINSFLLLNLTSIRDFYFFLLPLSFLLVSCSPTEPEDNIEPGRRDYVWTVDTVSIPYSSIREMWGSSPDDIWAIASAGDFDSTIYHYDGTKWSTDGVYRTLDPASIYGFGKDDVWIGGHEGEIWHYKG